MNTTRLEFNKIDFEKVMITLAIILMEGFGVLTLVCGILGIKIF